MAAAAAAPLPSKPTASLANMTSGTTFAAKARAAELNAVRARRAIKDTNDQDDTTMPTAMSGPVKLNKPRSRGRGGWKPLNLDEIPESTTEADQLAYDQISSTDMGTGPTSQQRPYSEVRPSRYRCVARLIRGPGSSIFATPGAPQQRCRHRTGLHQSRAHETSDEPLQSTSLATSNAAVSHLCCIHLYLTVPCSSSRQPRIDGARAQIDRR